MNLGEEGQPVQKRLGMWDTVAIIVGIVIGSTIFKSPQLIMGNVSSPLMGLSAWLLGGLLSLIGALCYAELASTYPRSGGDYYFLSRAFGSWSGFLFGWAQLAVILTASIGTMGFVFGEYAVKVFAPPGTEQTAEQKSQLKELAPESKEFKELQSSIAKETGTNRELWIAGFAAAGVVGLTLLNLLGVVMGKWMQNLLSLVKVGGLIAIAVIGFQFGKHDILPPSVQGVPTKIDLKDGAYEEVTKETDAQGKTVRSLTRTFNQDKKLVREVVRNYNSVGEIINEGVTKLGPVNFGLAMIFVLYAFGGWNDAAFVASEVRNRKHIVLALIIGTLLITIIYLIVNVAYLRALGFEKTRDFSTVLATDVAALHPRVGDQAAKIIGILVMISALGAVNGLIFTGSRVYSSFGADHSLFAVLGRWNAAVGAPIWSLLIQGVICLLMIGSVGTALGREYVDKAMNAVFEVSMPWERNDGFATLVSGSAPVFWIFFLMSGLSLFALRQRDQDIERPFTVPIYPLLPLIFCGTCGYMLYSAIDYAKWLSLIGAVPLAIGIPLYWISRERPGLND